MLHPFREILIDFYTHFIAVDLPFFEKLQS